MPHQLHTITDANDIIISSYHIFVYSVVVTRNSSHRDKNSQSLKTVNKQYKYKCNDQLIHVDSLYKYQASLIYKLRTPT